MLGGPNLQGLRWAGYNSEIPRKTASRVLTGIWTLTALMLMLKQVWRTLENSVFLWESGTGHRPQNLKPLFGVSERGDPTALANTVQHCRDRWCRPILHGLGDFLSSSLTKSYLSNFSQNFLEQPCLRSWGTLTQTESTTCTIPSAPECWRSFLSAERMENLGSCWSQGTSVFPNQINHVFHYWIIMSY